MARGNVPRRISPGEALAAAHRQGYAAKPKPRANPDAARRIAQVVFDLLGDVIYPYLAPPPGWNATHGQTIGYMRYLLKLGYSERYITRMLEEFFLAYAEGEVDLLPDQDLFQRFTTWWGGDR